jgi:hypothetical protein
MYFTLILILGTRTVDFICKIDQASGDVNIITCPCACLLIKGLKIFLHIECVALIGQSAALVST